MNDYALAVTFGRLALVVFWTTTSYLVAVPIFRSIRNKSRVRRKIHLRVGI